MSHYAFARPPTRSASEGSSFSFDAPLQEEPSLALRASIAPCVSPQVSRPKPQASQFSRKTALEIGRAARHSTHSHKTCVRDFGDCSPRGVVNVSAARRFFPPSNPDSLCNLVTFAPHSVSLARCLCHRVSEYRAPSSLVWKGARSFDGRTFVVSQRLRFADLWDRLRRGTTPLR
jgi:hypothetical protein